MAILCLGGNGIIGDFSPIPRMMNDSIINESWEGTHLIITDHFLHAISKRKVLESWNRELEQNVYGADGIKELEVPLATYISKKKEWEECLSQSKEWKEMNRVFLADRAYELFALSLIIMESFEENKKNKKEKNSVYGLLADSFSEIIENGLNGSRDMNRAILHPEKSKIILDY
jgi:hypothetical protein